MEDNKRHIDDFFREELGQMTEMPPASVWDTLENRLDESPGRKPRVWWFYIVVAILLVGSPIAAYYWSSVHTQHQQERPLQEIAPTATQQETVANTTADAIENEEEKSQIAALAKENNELPSSHSGESLEHLSSSATSTEKHSRQTRFSRGGAALNTSGGESMRSQPKQKQVKEKKRELSLAANKPKAANASADNASAIVSTPRSSIKTSATTNTSQETASTLSRSKSNNTQNAINTSQKKTLKPSGSANTTAQKQPVEKSPTAPKPDTKASVAALSSQKDKTSGASSADAQAASLNTSPAATAAAGEKPPAGRATDTKSVAPDLKSNQQQMATAAGTSAVEKPKTVVKSVATTTPSAILETETAKDKSALSSSNTNKSLKQPVKQTAADIAGQDIASPDEKTTEKEDPTRKLSAQPPPSTTKTVAKSEPKTKQQPTTPAVTTKETTSEEKNAMKSEDQTKEANTRTTAQPANKLQDTKSPTKSPAKKLATAEPDNDRYQGISLNEFHAKFEADQASKTQNETAETAESTGGNTPAQQVPDSKDRFRQIRFGIKAGYEQGYKQATAQKAVAAVFMELDFTKRLHFIMQPTIKAAKMNRSVSSSDGTYIDAGTTDRNLYNVVVDTFGKPIAYEYAFSQTYDSVLAYKTTTTNFTEFEFPFLFKYDLDPHFAVQAGLNFTFGQNLQWSGSMDRYTKILRDTVVVPDTSLPSPATKFSHPGQTLIASYNNPDGSAALSSTLRLGYTIGFSYTYRERLMMDLLLQQTLNGSRNITNAEVKSIFTQPYIRFMLGYTILGKRKK